MEYWIQGTQGFSYCIEMLAAAFCFFVFLQKRKKFCLRLTAGLLLLFASSLLFYPLFADITKQYNWVWYVGIYALIVGISMFCCDISWSEAVLAASCGALLQHTVSSLYILIYYRGVIPKFFTVKYWLLYILVYFGVAFVIGRKLTDEGHYHTSWANAAVMAATATIIVLVLSVLAKSTTIDVIGVGTANTEYIKLFRINQVYALGACVLVLVLQAILQRELRVQKTLSENKNLWTQRQLQYEMSRENIAMITRKCHDMKHQIEALIQTESHSERRKSFIENVQDMIEVYDNDVHTGNEALDTILMEKGLYCKVHHIDWTCVADGKLLEFMDVVDLFTVMGNALDNAVESVEKRAKDQYKSIGVRVWKKDLFAVIQVENTFDGELKMKDGLPLTSKADKENHGIGIRSIKSIVEKYQGTVSVRVQDRNFVLTVLLPIMS
ncbi:ATP-binding protein [Blautia sp.]